MLPDVDLNINSLIIIYKRMNILLSDGVALKVSLLWYTHFLRLCQLLSCLSIWDRQHGEDYLKLIETHRNSSKLIETRWNSWNSLKLIYWQSFWTQYKIICLQNAYKDQFLKKLYIKTRGPNCKVLALLEHPNTWKY